jgi:hypothetical protein
MNARWPAGLALCALLFGCAAPEVRFMLREGSRVPLTDVRRLAVLTFASPYGNRQLGETFAVDVADHLSTLAGLAVLPPAEAAPGLAPLRLRAGDFNDPRVVAEAGKVLGVDALLFGDVQTAEVRRTVKRETNTVQTGVRRETVMETGPDGQPRAVTYAYPVTREAWRNVVKRTFVFHAEARLVRARDAAQLWQESSDWTGESLAEEDEQGQRRGDWSTDEEFRNKQMRRAALNMLAGVLPRALNRTRVLAEAAAEGPYAEWVSAGNQAAVAGRWEEAGGDWLKAVSLAPNRPEAHANLGVLREHQGDYLQAQRDYELAARQAPQPWGTYAEEVRQFLEKNSRPAVSPPRPLP